MSIGIFNKTEEKIDKSFVRKVVKHTLKKMEAEKSEVNIIFVGLEEIHEINKTYRNVDRPTDVISFALEDTEDVTVYEERVLGDIYICLDKVHEQAKEYGHTEIREMAFLIVHGLLHLLGYDHMIKEEEKIMFGLQEEILNEMGITR
ncbi:probable rRNA maturation factor [Firmicutes bacterium CAG:884]|jgi:probable rRNA maturation factor|nr:rRNA maturation RNase YbeY [Bacillota bacterium]CCY93735.1 probable rRNA maturation factor [Firmicutes bacterium CAG:884]